MRKHPFLLGCSSAFLSELTKVAKDVAFPQGTIILQEGEYADRCFLICSGQVELTASNSRRSAVPIQVLGPGDVLGWSWLYPPFEWHFSARALEFLQAMELDAASLLERAEKDAAFGYELMKRFSMQLVERLQATRARLAEVSHRLEKGERTP